MKKVFLIMILIFSGFMINMSCVYADDSNNYNGSYRDQSDIMQQKSTDCGILGDSRDPNTFAYYLQVIFDVMKFLGPVLILIMTIVDLVKITAEQKQDGELQKIGVKTLKRFLYAVIIFVLPSIITALFHMIGLYGSCVN